MSILDLDEIFQDFIVAPSDLPYFHSKEQYFKIHTDYQQHLQKTQASKPPQQPVTTSYIPLPVHISQPFMAEPQKIIAKKPFTVVRGAFLEKLPVREDDQISLCSTALGGSSITGSPQSTKNTPKRHLDDGYWNEEDTQNVQQKIFVSNNGGFFKNNIVESPLPIGFVGTPQKVKAKGKGKKLEGMLKLPGSVTAKVRKDLGEHLEIATTQWFDPNRCVYMHRILTEAQNKGADIMDFKRFLEGKSYQERCAKIYREIINKCVNGFLSKEGEKEFNYWMESSVKLTREKKEEIYRYREVMLRY